MCPLWWKKSAHRLWKGLVGRIGGVGGSDAWEGDITLHMVHDDRWFDMSAAMPGQKMDASAFACIIVVPWWAEWRNWRQSSRNAGGMTTLSLKMTTPSTETMDVKLSDIAGHLSLLWREAFFYQLDQLLEVNVCCRRFLETLPCDGGYRLKS